MKHTPGPWKMVDRQARFGNNCGINIESDDLIICKLPDGASTDGGHGWPHQLANAKIIQEAPNLLLECQKLSAACESLMGEVVGKTVTDWGLVNDALIQSAKAIKRATE